MSHDHSHQHVDNFNRAFALGVALNTGFVLIEAGYGMAAGSLALIADAGHNLSDVMSLLLAWGASILARQSATEKRTYGFRKATILASLISAVFLLFALGIISWEAVGRLQQPKPVEGLVIIVVAGIGVVINTATALLFVSGQKHDLNIRGAFLHMAADAGVSLGVVVAGVVTLQTGWLWLDPAISLLIVAVIFIGSWGLFRDSVFYVLDFVPRNIDSQGIQEYLMSVPKVQSIHDLHIWPLSTTETALTVHLIVDDNCLDNRFLADIQKQLHDLFGVEHSTIQIESLASENQCQLRHMC